MHIDRRSLTRPNPWVSYQADIAMYRAKAQGKGRHHVFGPGDIADPTGRAAPPEPDAPRGLSFRKPTVRHPAFGSDPG